MIKLSTKRNFIISKGLIAALSKRPTDVTVTSLSQTHQAQGCSVFWAKHWFTIQWGECWKDVHTTIKELLPVIVASAMWGKNGLEGTYCSGVIMQWWSLKLIQVEVDTLSPSTTLACCTYWGHSKFYLSFKAHSGKKKHSSRCIISE